MKDLFIEFLTDANKLEEISHVNQRTFFISPSMENHSISLHFKDFGIEYFYDKIIYWIDGIEVKRGHWLEAVEDYGN